MTTARRGEGSETVRTGWAAAVSIDTRGRVGQVETRAKRHSPSIRYLDRIPPTNSARRIASTAQLSRYLSIYNYTRLPACQSIYALQQAIMYSSTYQHQLPVARHTHDRALAARNRYVLPRPRAHEICSLGRRSRSSPGLWVDISTLHIYVDIIHAVICTANDRHAQVPMLSTSLRM